jgi:hypothetical protein
MVNSCPNAAIPLTKTLDCEQTVPQGGDVETLCGEPIVECTGQGC